MKNIYLLPTDKPSRLLKDLVDGTYQLKKEVLYGNRFELPLNIYITNDEEIKEGDWYITILDNEIVKADSFTIRIMNDANKYSDTTYKNTHFKIILTTDQGLIKDGVDAIDDEFLEWFVNNPSCERVDVRFFCCGGYDDKCEPKCFRKSYEIIIPKEEPKQECTITKIMQMDAKMAYDSLPKQETLEEADEIITPTKFNWKEDKKMYSEEDIIKFVSFVGKNYIKAKGFYYMKGDFEKKHKVSIHQILEQFKKK